MEPPFGAAPGGLVVAADGDEVGDVRTVFVMHGRIVRRPAGAGIGCTPHLPADRRRAACGKHPIGATSPGGARWCTRPMPPSRSRTG